MDFFPIGNRFLYIVHKFDFKILEIVNKKTVFLVFIL